MPRPSKDNTFMTIASAIAKRSTCKKRAVGVVIVTPVNTITSVGYNGAPRGLPHCTDDECLLDMQDRCIRATHAEINALLQAQRSVEGHTLYTTLLPCVACANAIINAGIIRVVYLETGSPRTSVIATEFFDAAGIEHTQFSYEEDFGGALLW